TCHSNDPVFGVGDFLSMRGSVFSFFEKNSMSPATFSHGGTVRFVHQDAASMDAEPSRQPAKEKTSAKPATPAAVGRVRAYDMTKKEMSHFHSKHRSVQQL